MQVCHKLPLFLQGSEFALQFEKLHFMILDTLVFLLKKNTVFFFEKKLAVCGIIDYRPFPTQCFSPGLSRGPLQTGRNFSMGR